MKIDINTIDKESFKITEGVFCGVESYLIIPKEMGTDWTIDNLKFRSMIVDKFGYIASLNYFKFFNYSEKPHLYPDPANYKDWKCELKIDGSAVNCDYYNEQFSMRTRGTMSHKTQTNYADFEHCAAKYPLVEQWLKNNPNITLLFEIVTPNNQIVIRYNEVDWLLCGAMNKDTCSHLNFDQLNNIAADIRVARPEVFEFNNLAEIAEKVKDWKGKEGVVLKYNNHANYIKFKSADYLLKHAFRDRLNLDTILDLFIAFKKPSYDEFLQLIEKQFDFECSQAAKPLCQTICEAQEKVKNTLDKIEKYVIVLSSKTQSRKEQAQEILRNPEFVGITSYVFAGLDKRILDDKGYKKLMEIFLEK